MNWCSLCGKQCEGSAKIKLPHDPAIPTSGPISKELKAESQRDICAPTFLAAVFIIAKRWKPPKCPWRDEWVIKRQCMRRDVSLKRKEILSLAATRRKPED